MGHDGQGRTLPRARRFGGVNEIALDTRRDVKVGGRTARNAAPVDPAIRTTHNVPSHHRMRAFDRDLIRGGHYGQRSCEPHLKAEHMAAPTNAAYVKKALANSEPSTHGTNRTCVAALHESAFARSGHQDFMSTRPRPPAHPGRRPAIRSPHRHGQSAMAARSGR